MSPPAFLPTRPASVPQRSTATPPPRSAIQPGCVPLFRAQPPTWLRLREVRDEEAAGSNPVTPTTFFGGGRPLGGVGGLAQAGRGEKQGVGFSFFFHFPPPPPPGAARGPEGFLYLPVNTRGDRQSSPAKLDQGGRSGSWPGQDGAPAIASAFPVVARVGGWMA